MIAVVILLLLLVAQRATQPRTTVLVRNPSTGAFLSAGDDHADATPGLLLYRFDAPLFFANATLFADEILALIDDSDVPIRPVVVSAEAITSVDSTAEAMLRDLLAQLRERGVGLGLARPKKPLRDSLGRTGLLDEIGRDHVYPRVSDAVEAYLAEDTDSATIR